MARFIGSHLLLLGTGCGALLLPSRAEVTVGPPPAEPPATVREVRNLVNGYRESFWRLVRMGKRAHPALEAILTHPKVQPHEADRIFSVLSESGAKEPRFVELAIRHLDNSSKGVRASAFIFLSRACGPEECPLLIAGLSDADILINYAAPKALLRVGGPREVVAMSAWLRGVAHRKDAKFRAHVAACRDQLKARLATQRK